MKLKERAKKLKTNIPAVYFALKNTKTPWVAKALALFTIVYAFSPIDLIPDFIPVLGYLDDIIILPALIALTIKLIPKEIIEECRKTANENWSYGNLKKWYFAIPFLFIWMAVIIVIVKFLLSFKLKVIS